MSTLSVSPALALAPAPLPNPAEEAKRLLAAEAEYRANQKDEKAKKNAAQLAKFEDESKKIVEVIKNNQFSAKVLDELRANLNSHVVNSAKTSSERCILETVIARKKLELEMEIPSVNLARKALDTIIRVRQSARLMAHAYSDARYRSVIAARKTETDIAYSVANDDYARAVAELAILRFKASRVPNALEAEIELAESTLKEAEANLNKAGVANALARRGYNSSLSSPSSSD